MLDLILCIVANIFVVVCFKLFDRKGVDSFIAIVVNYWVCLVLGSLFVGHVPILTYGFETGWVPYGLALGLLFIIGFNIVALSVKHTGIAITSVMMKMSLLISSTFAIVFFMESAGVFKVTGISLSVLAIVLINASGNSGGKKFSPGPYFIYPAIALLFSAAIEIVLYYVQSTDLSLDADAELTTFGFSVAAVIGAVVVAYLYITGKRSFKWKDYIGGILLGLPNFFSIYLILVLLQKGFEGSVVFPVLNISVLVATALVGVIAFGEELKPVNYLGIGLAVISILSIMLF
jgi:drug/metabolite transporter (DMT)-like permease